MLLILNEDIVERAEGKLKLELGQSTRVKDGIRTHAIEDILMVLNKNVIEKANQFDNEFIKETLDVFAQLIDWNELSHFEELIKNCINILQ